MNKTKQGRQKLHRFTPFLRFLTTFIALGVCFAFANPSIAEQAKQPSTRKAQKQAAPAAKQPNSKPITRPAKKATKKGLLHSPPKGYTTPKYTQLTKSGVNGEAYFSPDGSQFIFQSYGRPKHANAEVYIYNLKTHKETRVTKHDGDVTCTYFHPTQKTILYASTGDEVRESHKFKHFAPSFVARHKAKMKKLHPKKKTKKKRRYSWVYKPFEIYTSAPDGTQQKRLTHATGYDAEGTYSPDGKYIIFSSHRDKDQELYLMNADGTNQRRLTWRRGNDGGAFISPDNKQVTWRSFDFRGNSQIMVANLVAGQLTKIRQLTYKAGINWAPFWHPSGKWILFSSNRDQRGNFELYLVNTEGSCLKRITYKSGSDVLPVFSPDGKTILFTHRRNKGHSQIYKMPFVMPPGCLDPKQFKKTARILKFGKAPSKHKHGHKHSYRKYKHRKHKHSKGKHQHHKYSKSKHRYGSKHRYSSHKHAKTTSAKPSNPALEQIKRDLHFLSHPVLEGRDAGTRGIKIAADYIAHQFKALGFASWNKKRIKKPYHQPFKASLGVTIAKGNQLSTHDQKGSKKWIVGKDYVPFGFSANGKHKAKVIFAGYGITASSQKYDDYEDIDVKGKVVLLLRKAPRWKDAPKFFKGKGNLYSSFRYKVLNARTHGARAVLIVDPPSANEKVAPKLVRTSLSRGLTDAGLPAFHIKRAIAKQLLESSGYNLENLLLQIQKTKQSFSKVLKAELSYHVILKKQEVTVNNIVGILPGTDPKLQKEFIVIGAHYDHLGYGHNGAFPGNHGKIHPGADDNGSGTAALLSFARSFAKSPLPRPIIFIAFAGEERGLLGSAYFVRHSPVPLKQIVTMANFDMIGRMKGKRLMVHGSGTALAFAPLLRAYGKRYKLELKLGESGYGPSDHSSFYAKKIPVLFFFTGAHKDYHRPGDTYDTINFDGLWKVVRYATTILKKVGSLHKHPVYRRVLQAKPKKKMRGGMRAYLGTIPDYSGGRGKIKGVALTGVRANGPAAKAGLIGDDVIVQIGKFPIHNLYDMVIALKEYQAGDVVTIIVVRKGKRSSHKATFGQRHSNRR